jgi:hypothetical protein
MIGFRLAAAAALGIALIGSANASPSFTYGSYEVVNNQGVSISGPGGFNEYGGSGQVILVGSGPDAGKLLDTWCIDVGDWLAGSGTFTIGGWAPSDNGTAPPNPASAALTHSQIGEIGALIQYGKLHLYDSYDTSSGIQIAIWETEYSTLGYTFSGSSGADAVAADLLGMSLTPWYGWEPLFSENSDGVVTNQAQAAAVPEPTTFMLVSAALLGVGVLRRRR